MSTVTCRCGFPIAPNGCCDRCGAKGPDYRQPGGAGILDSVRAELTRYVVFPSDEAADAVALWIVATHAQPAWDCAPRLQVKSPLKQCGKSRLLDLVETLCNEPLMMVYASPAALFRSIDEHEPPTLLVDETDTIFGTKDKTETQEAIRGILNAGHQRGRTIPRCVPPTQIVKHFPTFAMAALAGIGSMPDTIEDRSVIVELRRRAPDEIVAKLRWKRVRPGLHTIRDQVHAWARDHMEKMRDADPELPVDDRAADTWEPLVSVADIAAGDWPERARAACKKLTGATAGNDIDRNLSVRLLADLRDVFARHDPADRAHTEALLTELRKIDEAPWHDYFGHPIDSRDLARLLSAYGIKSRDVWINGVNKKGYRKEDLWDTWKRYLPPVEGMAAPLATGELWPESPDLGARSARSARSASDLGERPSGYETVNARSARCLADLAPGDSQGLGADQAPSPPSPPSPTPKGDGTTGTAGGWPEGSEGAAANSRPTPRIMPQRKGMRNDQA